MISSQQALNETIRILKEHLSDVSGETGGSHAYGFYQLAQNIFVKFRVADHGLYMQTFVSHDNGVAPELVSIISVVYRESPKEPIGTKWKTNGYPNSIIAFQYVYPCWDMDFDDIPPIAFELITFAKTSTFVPPHLCTKDVKVQEITSDIGIRDVTNKLRARYCSIKESKTNKRIETWYRGFNREYGIYGEETPHLLWLTTDLNYAKEYGDAIMEYKIDMSKCHGSIDGMGYLFDFDMSEGPSAEYASYLLNEYGVNSYCYYGGLTESSYCMCLWDETPIVSQRILDNNEIKESKNMKKNIVKINESTLRKMVTESIKKVLNEYAEGNEMSPVPGDNYSPTPQSLIQTIIDEAKNIDVLLESVFQSVVKNDTEKARKGLSQMGQLLDVVLDRASELQGFIEQYSEGNADY